MRHNQTNRTIEELSNIIARHESGEQFYSCPVEIADYTFPILGGVASAPPVTFGEEEERVISKFEMCCQMAALLKNAGWHLMEVPHLLTAQYALWGDTAKDVVQAWTQF